MVIKKKTYSEVLADALAYVTEGTDLTLTSPGSTLRALMEAVAHESSSLWSMLDVVVSQTYISTASGMFLDLLGELVGVSRLALRAAYTTKSDRNIKFYVNTGTLGAVAPKPGDATKALIPSGTTITSANGTVVFAVDGNHEINANATEIYVTARATSVASDKGNVGSGVLTIHSLENQTLLVTNIENITSGSSIESDEHLRARVKAAVRAGEGANELAIRIAALSVGGVANIILNEFTEGAGSFEVLIVPEGNRVPLVTLQRVRKAIDQVVAFGMAYNIREPRYLPLSLDIELDLRNTPDVDQELVRNTAAGALTSYVGSIFPGESLVINSIREVVMGAHSDIYDVHIRALRINGRPQMITNYQLAHDEVFIPDPKEIQPIILR